MADEQHRVILVRHDDVSKHCLNTVRHLTQCFPTRWSNVQRILVPGRQQMGVMLLDVSGPQAFPGAKRHLA
jgi:hypothetical protein